MFMNDTRSFIDMETLEVEFHAAEYYFEENEMEDTAEEALDNPDKFFPIEHSTSSKAFEVMEAFVETINDNMLRSQLIRALQRKKPFANFKYIIDNSPLRQEWFQFKDEAYAEIAKKWIGENASDELKKKIQQL
jgi:Uncharacterised protein family (UPF0158)